MDTPLQIIGNKKSGKTTTMISFIEEATLLNKKVAVFKHTHHSVSMDVEKTDTYRFSKAGASQVGMQQQGGFYWHEQRPMDQEVPLKEEIEDFVRLDTDIILIEGFKNENYPKLLLLRPQDTVGAFQDYSKIQFIATIFKEKIGEPGVLDFTTEEKRKAWFKNYFAEKKL